MLTNVAVPQLFEHTGEWITSCQTYEGGFGAVPGIEAHGGYTFCGFAALMLLRKQRFCSLQRLLVRIEVRWVDVPVGRVWCASGEGVVCQWGGCGVPVGRMWCASGEGEVT